MNIRHLCAAVFATTIITNPIIYAQGVTTTPTSIAPAAPVTAVPAEAVAPSTVDTNPVGISSRDGITFSGTDVLVTRNGVSERLTKELELPNGLRVMPDGSFSKGNNDKVMLRSGQVLTFDGKLLDAPVVESGDPAKASAEKPVGSATAK